MRRADGLGPRMSPRLDTRPGSSSTVMTMGRPAWARMLLTRRMSWDSDTTLPGLRKIPPTPMSRTVLTMGSDGSVTSGMPTMRVRAARWARETGLQLGTVAGAATAADRPGAVVVGPSVGASPTLLPAAVPVAASAPARRRLRRCR